MSANDALYDEMCGPPNPRRTYTTKVVWFDELDRNLDKYEERMKAK